MVLLNLGGRIHFETFQEQQSETWCQNEIICMVLHNIGVGIHFGTFQEQQSQTWGQRTQKSTHDISVGASCVMS